MAVQLGYSLVQVIAAETSQRRTSYREFDLFNID